MTDRYQRLREEYEGRSLGDITHDGPWPLFGEWQTDAEREGLQLANAMAIATADASGKPSVRMVLLKNIDEQERLWFFTDYESRKGRELAENPRAELMFYWQPLHRQVRVNGTVERLPEEESDAYFHARPRASSISAIASQQSLIVDGGHIVLEQARATVEAEFEGRDLVRPPRWGGYAVTPATFEFWQGRPDRLHHRLYYVKDDAGAWTRTWLAP